MPRLFEEIAGGGVRRPGPHGEVYDPLFNDIGDRLLQLGVVAHEHYNGIDLAVANSAEDEHGMIIAVSGDGPDYASIRGLRQRDRVVPERLERRGWKFMRVWSTDAFVDPQAETEKIFDAWKSTVETMSPQAILNAARAASVVVGRTGDRPKLVPGLPMHKYSDEGLDAMIDWIQSDAVVRGDGEIKELLRTALAQKSAPRAGRLSSRPPSTGTASAMRRRRRSPAPRCSSLPPMRAVPSRARSSRPSTPIRSAPSRARRRPHRRCRRTRSGRFPGRR
ncbi:hypothetical protein IOD13_13205 [Brevibacterium casei]|nr:hypothetical protein [Brevibacterium casei]